MNYLSVILRIFLRCGDFCSPNFATMYPRRTFHSHLLKLILHLPYNPTTQTLCNSLHTPPPIGNKSLIPLPHSRHRVAGQHLANAISHSSIQTTCRILTLQTPPEQVIRGLYAAYSNSSIPACRICRPISELGSGYRLSVPHEVLRICVWVLLTRGRPGGLVGGESYMRSS